MAEYVASKPRKEATRQSGRTENLSDWNDARMAFAIINLLKDPGIGIKEMHCEQILDRFAPPKLTKTLTFQTEMFETRWQKRRCWIYDLIVNYYPAAIYAEGLRLL